MDPITVAYMLTFAQVRLRQDREYFQDTFDPLYWYSRLDFWATVIIGIHNSEIV